MIVFECSGTAWMKLGSGATNEMLYPIQQCLMLIFCHLHSLADGPDLQALREHLYHVQGYPFL